MTDRTKAVLRRFARGLAAVVVAFVATTVVSEEFLGLVPDQYDFLVTGIVAPLLLAADKALRSKA